MNREKLVQEIQRVKAEIVMGAYNGSMMTEDYKKRLKRLEAQLKKLDNE